MAGHVEGESHRPIEAATSWRSVVAVLVLVGGTTAAVLLARDILLRSGLGLAAFGLVFGSVVLAIAAKRLRVAGADARRPLVATTERDGPSVSTEARRHRRFVPARRTTLVHLHDGRRIAARIVDISIAGVAVEARLTDRDMLAVTRVGSRTAGPVRRTPKGAVFGFDTLLEPQPFDATFAL